MSAIKLEVPAISCGHCVNTIQMELIELEGVESVSADVESKLVDVSYQDPATEENILALLDEINFPAVNVLR